eukprot:scaffold64865_cov33-Tisochrysis_lutea.AAC.1
MPQSINHVMYWLQGFMRCKAENTHLECQSSATRNFWRGAMSAVRIVMAADALVPPLDDGADSNIKLEEARPVTRRVELRAVSKRASVVHLDLRAYRRRASLSISLTKHLLEEASVLCSRDISARRALKRRQRLRSSVTMRGVVVVAVARFTVVRVLVPMLFRVCLLVSVRVRVRVRLRLRLCLRVLVLVPAHGDREPPRRKARRGVEKRYRGGKSTLQMFPCFHYSTMTRSTTYGVGTTRRIAALRFLPREPLYFAFPPFACFVSPLRARTLCVRSGSSDLRCRSPSPHVLLGARS